MPQPVGLNLLLLCLNEAIDSVEISIASQALLSERHGYTPLTSCKQNWKNSDYINSQISSHC